MIPEIKIFTLLQKHMGEEPETVKQALENTKSKTAGFPLMLAYKCTEQVSEMLMTHSGS
jgi:hypothetical protein